MRSWGLSSDVMSTKQASVASPQCHNTCHSVLPFLPNCEPLDGKEINSWTWQRSQRMRVEREWNKLYAKPVQLKLRFCRVRTQSCICLKVWHDISDIWFLFLVLRRTKNHLLIQRLKELLRRGVLTEVKLSPDCPLVEVLEEARDDRWKHKPCSPGWENSVLDCSLLCVLKLPHVGNYRFLKNSSIARLASNRIQFVSGRSDGSLSILEYPVWRLMNSIWRKAMCG